MPPITLKHDLQDYHNCDRNQLSLRQEIRRMSDPETGVGGANWIIPLLFLQQRDLVQPDIPESKHSRVHQQHGLSATAGLLKEPVISSLLSVELTNINGKECAR